MTGHQVFSTLHAHSVLGVIPRLIDVGISKELLAGNLKGIVAQRLLRKLCPHCKIARPTTPHESHWLNHPGRTVEATGIPPSVLYRAQGCEQCHQRGYRGRFAVMEILRMDDELDELLFDPAPVVAMRKKLEQRAHSSLTDQALQHLMAGHTSLEEIIRVLGLAPVRSSRKHNDS